MPVSFPIVGSAKGQRLAQNYFSLSI